MRNIYKQYINGMQNLSSKLIKLFGIFGIINYPWFCIYQLFYNGIKLEEIILRAIASIICLTLIFIDYWPLTTKRYQPFIWLSSITFCLPFFSTVLLIQNHGSDAWILNITFGLFWLLLICDWITFFISLFAGVLLGIIYHKFIYGDIVLLENSLAKIAINSVWSVVLALFFLRRKDMIYDENLSAVKSFGGAIAHELKTPLAAVAMQTEVLKDAVPMLVEAYKKSHLANTVLEEIDDEHLDLILKAPDRITQVNNRALFVIKLLLTNIKDDLHIECSDKISINYTLNEVIATYPFQKSSRIAIKFIPKQDFKICCNMDILQHVFWNLIKNAVHYINIAQKGEIVVWTKRGKKRNYVYFKDTATGIDSKHINKIFDNFFTTNRYGTGLGLSFCKRVMQNLGGDITCKSALGEHTTFILSFPKLN